MVDIPFCQVFKITKPTNAFHLSRKVGEGELFVRLMHEDREVIRPLKVKSFSGNEIILSETINPESVEHKYMRECIGDCLDLLGKILREDIFVEVFYKP